MSINIHWPSSTWEPREGQSQLLETIISRVEEWDVCVIEAPTAFGKTIVSKALLRWASKELKMKGMLLEPNNMLVEQVKEGYGFLSLMRKDQYQCTQFPSRSCETTKAKEKGHCKGCPYTTSLRQIRAVPYGVMSYHMYMAHKFKHPFVIVDEAHNAVSVLQDLAGRKIWHRDYRWPSAVRTVGDLRVWLQTCPGYDREFPYDPLLKLLLTTLNSPSPEYLVEITEDYLRGQLESCIKLLPLTTANFPPYLWPGVKKLVLMSATISRVDVEELGLANKRILYLKAPSPIPVEQRPIEYTPIGSMAFASQQGNLEALAGRIKELMNKHEGKKGLVHLTYSLSAALYPFFQTDNRAVFHTSSNKQNVFNTWTERTDGAVLFACGMHEGIDLVGDLGHWQAICKIPYPSLQDTAVRWKLSQSQDWYTWQAVKLTAQAVGRICRTEKDYGITYILDSSFEKIQNSELIPAWMKAAYSASP